MKLGITLPLVDIQGDPATVRDFAQAAEAMGYHHLGAPDHVLGVNVASRPDWGNRNTSKDCFHDPFVMFGFLSACTRTIEFSTQVMILPQRQTALVAKAEFAKLRAYIKEAGRDPGTVGLEVWVTTGDGGPDDWRKQFQAWKNVGVTHVTVNSCYSRGPHKRIAGRTVSDHMAAMQQY